MGKKVLAHVPQLPVERERKRKYMRNKNPMRYYDSLLLFSQFFSLVLSDFHLCLHFLVWRRTFFSLPFSGSLVIPEHWTTNQFVWRLQIAKSQHDCGYHSTSLRSHFFFLSSFIWFYHFYNKSCLVFLSPRWFVLLFVRF